jgi:phosphohistidine phosphatase
MDYFLIRHAIAAPRDSRRWPDDGARPLTAEGERKFRRAAAGLAQLLPTPSRVFTSPLVRARATAALLETASWPRAIECPELAADQSASVAFARIARLAGEGVRRAALVGHEPQLSLLLALMIAGPDASLGLEIKKGGAAHVRFTAAVRAGRGRLIALFPPKALRALR